MREAYTRYGLQISLESVLVLSYVLIKVGWRAGGEILALKRYTAAEWGFKALCRTYKTIYDYRSCVGGGGLRGWIRV